jgi:general secretion pathway protein A
LFPPVEDLAPPLEQSAPAPQPPFATDATDLRFLHHSVQHDRAAQAMLGAIQRRDGIVVLTGEPGVGKTMLCRAVMEQLDRRTLTSIFSEPFVSGEELLKVVLLGFGVISRDDLSAGRLSHASRADLMKALRDFLATLAPLHAFAVIVIDDAETVPADLVRDMGLLAENAAGARVLQLVLSGRPVLLDMMKRSPLKALNRQVSVRCVLGPLTPGEIGGYVEHRLAAGGGPRFDFDAGALRKIYDLSRGVPRAVNLLCERALAVAGSESRNSVDEGAVAAAAEYLEPGRPHSAIAGLRMVAWVLLFVVMMVAGAALALVLLRADLSVVIDAWR